MAAAYAYSIIKNHPFLDGNKRTGTAATVVFLQLNYVKISFKKGELYSLALAIASSKITQKELAAYLEKRAIEAC